MNTYKLSIIIPIYNVEKYIKNCLDSIVNQVKNHSDEIEVLLIDDGSKDDSGHIADEYSLDNSFIKVIHKANAGVAAARNTGIALSKGEWLFFVDSDDWVADEAISHILTAISRYSESDVILFDAYKNDDDSESAWEHFENEKIFKNHNEIFNLQCGTLYFPFIQSGRRIPISAPWDKLYKKSFLEEEQLCFQKELKVLDDMIFNMEVFGRAKKVSYCKSRIYHYRYVSDSITHQYKPNRIDEDMKVWSFIASYISLNNMPKEFEQAFYCRIVKSFAISFKLSLFNPQNKVNYKDMKKKAREVIDSYYYNLALKNVEMANLEWKLKPVVLFARIGWMDCLYLLYKAEMILK